MIRLLCCILLLLMCWSYTANAQTTRKISKSELYAEDLENWFSADITYKVSKPFRISAGLGTRTSDGLSSLKYHLFDLGASYKVFDFLKVDASYRAQIRPTETRHRIVIQANASVLELDRLDVDYRIRYQIVDRAVRDSKLQLRHRIKASYNLPNNPINPFVHNEWYQSLSGSIKGFNKVRWGFGFDVELIKDLDFSLFAIQEKSFNVEAPERTWIVGVGFGYTIKGY